MKSVLFFAIMLLLIPTLCLAGDWRPLETEREARQRHSSERYQRYQRKIDRNPMYIPNSYNEKLGDPAPRGTSTPGRQWESPYRKRQHDKRRSFEHREWK